MSPCYDTVPIGVMVKNNVWCIFLARSRIDLQISIFGFSHELLVFSIFHLENVKSESYTPLSDF
jgi:hypothetical protein